MEGHRNLFLSMFSACWEPPLSSGVHKYLWVFHIWRQGWNQSSSPRVMWLRKEGWNLSPVLASQWSMDLCCLHWLSELSIHGMSKWTMDAPVAGMALAISAMGLEGMQRQDWDLGCFHSFYGGSKCMTTAIWYLNSVDLCEDLLCRDNIWLTPGPIAGFARVEAELRAVPTTV